MYKNRAGKWHVFAFEGEAGTNPGDPVTGDAANITANLYIDGSVTANAVDDTNPTELQDGYYVFDVTAAETNGDEIVIVPSSATANVNVVGVPGAVYPKDPPAPEKNVALSDIPVYLVQSSDHVSPATGETVAAEVSKDGAAFASAGGTVAEVSNGLYQFDATAADMNGDIVVFKFTSTNADDRLIAFQTVA